MVNIKEEISLRESLKKKFNILKYNQLLLKKLLHNQTQ